MKRPPILITAPAAKPVSVEDARRQCRIEGNGQDAMLNALIDTATARFDGYSGILGRTLITQDWQQDFGWYSGPLRLPFPNVSEAHAYWIDTEGTEHEVASVVVEDVIGPYVRLVGGVAHPAYRGHVRVKFKAGYGDTAAAVPAPIRQAILMTVGHLYGMSSEDGQIRSETVDGVGMTAFNSPEQTAIAITKVIDQLVRPYRRGNV